MNKEVTIICEPLRWYTQNDEEFVFTWLKRIKPIKRIQGIGTQLFLYFDSQEISVQDFREILAIFRRYRFKNRNQLEVFKNKDTEYLFKKFKIGKQYRE